MNAYTIARDAYYNVSKWMLSHLKFSSTVLFNIVKRGSYNSEFNLIHWTYSINLFY